MIKLKLQKNKNFVLAVMISFITIFLTAQIFCTRKPIYDAEYYWSWGIGIFNNGKIDFLSFPETFRGYLYPFIIAGLRIVGLRLFNSEWILFLLANSVMFTGIICTLIPKLINYDMNTKYSWIKSLIFSVFVVFFWKGHIIYSLSDVPAMAMMMWAVVILKELSWDKGAFIYFLKSFFAGVLCYAAYNTRAIYLYPVILLVLYYIIINLKKCKRILALFLVGVVLGSLLVAVPQMQINQKYTGSSTPRIMTEQLFNYSNNLQMVQVYEGIRVNRYESYVGSFENYNKPVIVCYDAIGQKIIQDEGLENRLVDFGLRDVIKLYMKYPVDFITIYVGHIISYLTIVWSDSTYVSNLNSDKYFYFLINAFIWLYALAGTIFKSSKDKSKLKCRDWVFITLVIISCIMSIPGMPEIRFFVPLYFLVYGYICYRINMKDIIYKIIKNKWRTLIAGISILFIWTGYAGNILKEAGTGTILFTNVSETGIVGNIPAVIRIMGYISLISTFMIVYIGFFNSKIKDKKAYIKELITNKKICLIACMTSILISILFSVWVLAISKDKICDLILPEILSESQEIFNTDKIEIPNSNGSVNVISTEFIIMPNIYYKIEFDMDIDSNIPSLFYFDFYNAGYDKAEQDILINLQKRKKHYSYKIFSGTEVPDSVYFRIVSITNREYIVRNLRIIKMKSNKKY